MVTHAKIFPALCLATYLSPAAAAAIHLAGKVTDEGNAAVEGALVSLTKANASARTDAQGRFRIDQALSLVEGSRISPAAPDPMVKGRFLQLIAPRSTQRVRVEVFALDGRYLGTPVDRVLRAGAYHFDPIATLRSRASGPLYLVKVTNGARTTAHIFLSDTRPAGAPVPAVDPGQGPAFAKAAAGVDMLQVAAPGYLPYSQDLPGYTDTGLVIQLRRGNAAGTGLIGQYFSDQNLKAQEFQRLDSTVDFDWGGGSPDPLIPNTERFSARWSGQVMAPVTGAYTFTTRADDGARLWVDGKALIDDWKDHDVTANSGTITLTAGRKYDIKLEYYQGTGGASIRLSWTPPGGASATVPAADLFPANLPCTPDCADKACGSNRCGGTCGHCGDRENCSQAGQCVSALCTTSALMGRCGPYPDYPQVAAPNPYVDQNVWGPVPGYTQSLSAYNPGDWWVVAKAPKGNTAVISYPNTGVQYPTSIPLANFSALYSSYSETMNETAETKAGAGYDIWTSPYGSDVMIQPDNVGRGSCDDIEMLARALPFGGANGVPTQTWNLCRYGTELIYQPVDAKGKYVRIPSGGVDMLAMLNWLVDHKYLPQNSTLDAYSFGWEICSTGGVEEKFQVTGYSVTAAHK